MSASSRSHYKPVLITRAHSAELELEAVIRHHVLLGMRVAGTVHGHGLGVCWGRRRWGRCRLLLSSAEAWVGGRHGDGGEGGGGGGAALQILHER